MSLEATVVVVSDFVVVVVVDIGSVLGNVIAVALLHHIIFS